MSQPSFGRVNSALQKGFVLGIVYSFAFFVDATRGEWGHGEKAFYQSITSAV